MAPTIHAAHKAAARPPCSRVALWLVCCLLQACSVIFSGDSGDDSSEKNNQKKDKRIPTSIIKRFVRTAVTPGGIKEWVLKAREGRIFENDHKIYLTDFILYFYRDGRVVSTLQARRGIINQRTEDIVAKHLVFLRSENGRTLTTEELYGNNKNKVITNAVFNRLTREDGSVLTGTHLWAHNDLKVFRLRDARGEIPSFTEGRTNSRGSSNRRPLPRPASNRSAATNRTTSEETLR